MTEFKTEMAKALFSSDAFNISVNPPYTWTSGYKMPVYNDNRSLLQTASNRQLVARGFSAIIAKHFAETEAVIGVATAGIPHATTLGDRLELPLGYVRSKAKEHGTKKAIEGFSKAGAKVVVIEDLISTGKSSVAAVKALQEEGLEVLGVLAIFSYGFPKADQQFRDANVPYQTLLTFDDLIYYAQRNKIVSSSDIEALRSWQSAPFEWQDKCAS